MARTPLAAVLGAALLLAVAPVPLPARAEPPPVDAGAGKAPVAPVPGTVAIYRLREPNGEVIEQTVTVTAVEADAVHTIVKLPQRETRSVRGLVPFGMPRRLDWRGPSGAAFWETAETRGGDPGALYPLAAGKTVSYETLQTTPSGTKLWQSRCAVEAAERVTVPAGTFQAWPVSCSHVAGRERQELRILFAPTRNVAVRTRSQLSLGDKRIDVTTELVELKPPAR